MKNFPRIVDKHYNLGEDFFEIAIPAEFPHHKLRFRNNRASKIIGLDKLTDKEWVNYFGKFHSFPKACHSPLALKYHGHQFGQYNPELGDGRGFLLCQILSPGRYRWSAARFSLRPGPQYSQGCRWAPKKRTFADWVAHRWSPQSQWPPARSFRW